MSRMSDADQLLADVSDYIAKLEGDLKALQERGRDEYNKDHKRLAQRVLALEEDLRESEKESRSNHDFAQRAKDKILGLKASNERLRTELAGTHATIRVLKSRGVKAKPERTCPSPGGCESCPRPTWCQLMRMRAGLTTPAEEEEFHKNRDMDWIYRVSIVDRNTPEEAPDEAR